MFFCCICYVILIGSLTTAEATARDNIRIYDKNLPSFCKKFFTESGDNYYDEDENLTLCTLSSNEDIETYKSTYNSPRILRGLRIENLTTSSLPTGLFKNVHVQDLDIGVCTLDTLLPTEANGERFFESYGDKSINQHISFQRMQVKKTEDWKTFFKGMNTLKKLALADIRDGFSTLWTNFASEISSELTDISLINMSITTVESKSLSCAKCFAILLSENNIKEMSNDAFQGSTQLLYLQLSDNQMTSLPEGLFEDLTQLRDLELQGNLFTELSPNIFDPLRSINTLVTFGGRKCDCEDKYLLGLNATNIELIAFCFLGESLELHDTEPRDLLEYRQEHCKN